jgi:hypothetical protein
MISHSDVSGFGCQSDLCADLCSQTEGSVSAKDNWERAVYQALPWFRLHVLNCRSCVPTDVFVIILLVQVIESALFVLPPLEKWIMYLRMVGRGKERSS